MAGQSHNPGRSDLFVGRSQPRSSFFHPRPAPENQGFHLDRFGLGFGNEAPKPRFLSKRVQRTIAAFLGLVFVLVGISLPWLGLERYAGETRFVMVSSVLLGWLDFSFLAVRPDLLKINWIVLCALSLLIFLGALWLR
jgi:hypothetical protein